MKSLIVVLLSVLVASCAGPLHTPTPYLGNPAGYAFLSISALKDSSNQSYSLYIRPLTAAPGDEKITKRFFDERQQGFTFFHKGSAWARVPDFSESAEEGVVLTARLAPGEYELFSATVVTHKASGLLVFSESKPFSIRFLVASSTTTYLGNFSAVPVAAFGTNGAPKASGATFTISSKLHRDEAIARTVNASLPAPTVEARWSTNLIESSLLKYVL